MPPTALDRLPEASNAGSASRKRPYQLITRSQSRSVTPTPPSKRRRTGISAASPSPSLTMSSTSISPQSSPIQRYAGDGFDYRRPTAGAIAAASAIVMPQTQPQNTIDLTLSDDDSALPSMAQNHPRASGYGRSATQSHRISGRSSRAEQQGRRSRQPEQNTTPDIIELSSDEEENREEDDIQVTGSRQLMRGSAPSSQNHNPRRHHSIPPAGLHRADAQTFGLATTAQAIRNGVGALGAYLGDQFQFGRAPPAGIQNIGHGRFPFTIPADLDLGAYGSISDIDDDEYDNIELNYERAAFIIEDPGADHGEMPKPPKLPTREGFTRDLEEGGDVLICVLCEEELAAGDDDIKRQIWASRKCGHVYCGTCASQRTARKSSQTKRHKAPKLEGLKTCSVDGCSAKLAGKTALFQIYL